MGERKLVATYQNQRPSSCDEQLSLVGLSHVGSNSRSVCAGLTAVFIHMFFCVCLVCTLSLSWDVCSLFSLHAQGNAI